MSGKNGSIGTSSSQDIQGFWTSQNLTNNAIWLILNPCEVPIGGPHDGFMEPLVLAQLEEKYDDASLSF